MSDWGARYLNLGRLGHHSAWRYLLGLLLILFFWFVIGSIVFVAVPIVFALVVQGSSFELKPGTISPAGLDRMVDYVAQNLSFVCFLVGILLAVAVVHGRSPRTLITPYRRVDWQRFWQGFALWFVLLALGSVAEALLHPGRYVFVLELPRFLWVALLVLLLTPIQTSTEELFFRGYLLQGFGLLNRNPLLLTFVTAAIFTLPHLGNPEISAGDQPALIAASYFITGALFALVTLRDDGLELALGIHASNNLFSALVANYTVSVLETDSIFLIREIDAIFNDVSQLIISAVFWLLAFHLFRRRVIS